MQKQKLLVIGSDLGSLSMVIEAKKRGLYVIVTDYYETSPAKEAADEAWQISTADLDLLEEKCRQDNVTALISGISDFNVTICIKLCQRLNLPMYCLSDKTWEYSRNKRMFKDICKACGVLVAQDYTVSNPPTEEELNQIPLPVVVKAIDQTANKGMSYCNTKEEIVAACDLARSVSNSDTVIIEDVLTGYEYGVHYALAEGEASMVGFFIMLNQPGYPSNCYSIQTTCSNNLNRYLDEFQPYFLDVVNKIGCNEGHLWVELREGSDGHLYALEMGHRMAADMVLDQLKLSGIYDAYEWLLDIATGIKHRKEDLPPSLTALPEKIMTSYILWSKEGGTITKIEGLDKLRGTSSINIVDTLIKVGKQVRKHQYLIILTFENESLNELCETIQMINNTVSIYDERGENIVIYYDDFKTLHQLDKESKL